MSGGFEANGRELLEGIPPAWREPATEVARTLAAAGHRAWIVGGCVRDLVLERPLKDLDIASAARPEEVEALFDRTVAVGRSFGIVVVVLGGVELEVATFRKERGYSDRRRPDEIEYADSPEVDAERRDFTCNALFLDPLDGSLSDPTGGLDDLRAGVLRAVGDPRARFREDGLRILRMARFLASLGLSPAPGLLDAARAEGDSLDGVSAERVLDELGKVLRGPAPWVALRTLHDGGHAARCVQGWSEGDAVAALRPDVLERLGNAPGLGLGLAALLEPAPLGPLDPDARIEGTLEAAAELRASRTDARAAAGIVGLRAELERAAEAPPPEGAEESGARVALWRAPGRADALRLALAWAEVGGDAARGRRLDALASACDALDAAAPSDPVELTAAELIDLGVERGPALGALLQRARHAALGGAFTAREGALAWVRAALR
ncbi:MAG: CCA tRNA nucleotidyltransferase [Planctomycetota bacterium]